MNTTFQPIGLVELIDQVKKDLLSSVPGQSKDLPFLFVESIQLELKIAITRSGEGQIKMDVLSFGGAELGGNISREQGQTVKVTLSSLFDRQQIMDVYQTMRPDEVLPALVENMKAVLKGETTVSADQSVG
jgi:Trypsin-co-occurring domain 2